MSLNSITLGRKMDSDEWRTEALCSKTETELQFSHRDKWLQQVCLECPVLGYCAQEVIDFRDQWKEKIKGQNNKTDARSSHLLTIGIWGAEYLGITDYYNHEVQSGGNATPETIRRLKSSQDKWDRLESRAINKNKIYKRNVA